MTDPGPQLHQKWFHSFEEDHDGVQVYRPEGFDFPRARGRAGLEFRADGTLVDLAVGRGDAPQPRSGSFRIADGRLHVSTPQGERSMTIVRAGSDRLELRAAGGTP